MAGHCTCHNSSGQWSLHISHAMCHISQAFKSYTTLNCIRVQYGALYKWSVLYYHLCLDSGTCHSSSTRYCLHVHQVICHTCQALTSYYTLASVRGQYGPLFSASHSADMTDNDKSGVALCLGQHYHAESIPSSHSHFPYLAIIQ